MKKGLGIERFDQEGRTIQATFEDFILFNLYIPNGGRDHARVPFKLDFYEGLLDLCQTYRGNGQNVILCGDINTAHEEIDVNNPKAKSKITGFLPKERAWITKFIEQGFVDVFRILYPQKEQYTYWSYVNNQRAKNNGWRLDYFLVSDGLASRVKDVFTHPEVSGSDHCPVTLILDL
jgi:exodeoxyribonuclease-3